MCSSEEEDLNVKMVKLKESEIFDRRNVNNENEKLKESETNIDRKSPQLISPTSSRSPTPTTPTQNIVSYEQQHQLIFTTYHNRYYQL